MNCNNYIEMINLQLDGKLPQEDYAVLSEHLKECESCRNYLRQLEAIKSQMAQMEEEVPECLHSSIISRIPASLPKKIPIYKSKYFGYAIAACILAVAVAGFLPQGIGMKKAGFDAESLSRAPDRAEYSDNNSYGGLMDAADEPTADSPEEINNGSVMLGQYVLAGKGIIPKEIMEMEDTLLIGNECFIYPQKDKMDATLQQLSDAGFTKATSYSLTESAEVLVKIGKDMIIVILE